MRIRKSVRKKETIENDEETSKKSKKKKSKILLIIGIVSLVFVIASVYFAYFVNNLYFKNFKEEINVEVFKKYKEKKEEACYGNKLRCKKVKYSVKGSVNTDKVGVYKVTYLIKYDGKTYKKIKKVSVVDKEKPTINIEGEISYVCPNGKIQGATVTATDNYDGDLTDKIKYKINGDKVIYRVKDSSGNIYKKELEASINDTEAPSIILNGDEVMYLGVSKEYEEPGYTAIDNCDDDVTSNVTVEGSVDSSSKGEYKLTYKVKDSYGNEAAKERVIKVFERNNYKPESLGDKVIYLTFDDGPGPYTAKLLDILKKYDVKATFFVIGINSNYDDMITREYNEGHTVALHSYTHNYATIYTGVDAFMDDLIRIQNKVKDLTGYEAKIMRFPGGASNTVSRKYRTGVMTELTSKVEELGFRYFDWNVSSGDAGSTTDTNVVYANVVNNIVPGRANVVLQHDIKGFSVDAVESIIQYGLSNGYVFAPLTMDSPAVQQRVNN